MIRLPVIEHAMTARDYGRQVYPQPIMQFFELEVDQKRYWAWKRELQRPLTADEREEMKRRCAAFEAPPSTTVAAA